MGVQQLSAIVARLRAAGAAAEHPAALIAHATLSQQRVLRAPLSAIAALALRQQIAPPALLIIGNVAALAPAERLRQLAEAPEALGASV